MDIGVFYILLACFRWNVVQATSQDPRSTTERYLVVINGTGRYTPETQLDTVKGSSVECIVCHDGQKSGVHVVSGWFTDRQIAELGHRDDVLHVEKDGQVQLHSEMVLRVQDEAPSWGLSRISQRTPTLNGRYIYPASAGEGVNVYIVDTGISIDSVDFGGRAIWGTTLISDDDSGATDRDEHGHGTAVAGIIGGSEFGVAKNCTMIAIKALNSAGTGRVSDVLRGMQWAIRHHNERSQKSVMNLSLGASRRSKIINMIAEDAIESGIVVVVAAGNEGKDACDFSPQSTKRAIVVGATDRKDRVASFSNRGPCLTVLAPGVAVSSIGIGEEFNKTVQSGTSFAAPYASGVAALLLAQPSSDPSGDMNATSARTNAMTPDELRHVMVNGATKNEIGPSELLFTTSTPNLLLYSLAGQVERTPDQKGSASPTTRAPIIYVLQVPLIMLTVLGTPLFAFWQFKL